MKRIKQRWDIEFPQKKRTTQTLVDNAKLFGKESLRPEDANIKAQKNMNWTTEMKIKLAKIDEEERNNGCELMKRIEMGLRIPWTSKWWHSCPEVFCKKGVIEHFAKFTGKHLCLSLFF